MSEVSCRVIDSHRKFMASIGLSIDPVLARVRSKRPHDDNLKPDIVRDRNRRIPWASFAPFLREFAEFMRSAGRPEWHEDFAKFILAEAEGLIPFRSTAAALIWSPAYGYRLNNMLLGPSTFGKAVEPALDELDDGRLKVTLKLAPGLEDSPDFFRITEFCMKHFPSIVDLGESIVEARIGSGETTYLITPPPAASLFSRLFRAIRVPFATTQVIKELRQQDRTLRDHYERLVKSEAELKEAHRLLEQRVEERTRELEDANVALTNQINEILARREENRDLTDRIHQLQKIEAVGTLVGGISHEINNVLHGTFLSLDLAERALPAVHPAKERVLMAKKFTKRGQSLMKQILAFSRKSRLEFKAIPLLPAIEDAIELMRSTLPKMITIEVDTTNFEPGTAVLSDATQLQQVLINLGSNAAYAMRKAGGRLTITLVKRPGDTDVTLKVRDSGEGIDESVRARIFEPFFTTKPLGEGTGVGLSVVHGIITAHGGKITLTSERGKGTEFTIVLPTVPLDLGEDEMADLQNIGGTEKILVVDDEVELLDLLKDTLGAFGYEVQTAKSADEALKAMGSAKFDLVLTDYSMPGQNGLDLARSIKRDSPRTKIILSTGYRDLFGSEMMDVVDAKVSKPLDALALNREIRACLATTHATSTSV